jgi:hypothetical protein
MDFSSLGGGGRALSTPQQHNPILCASNKSGYRGSSF